jgi:hypothetical protein
MAICIGIGYISQVLVNLPKKRWIARSQLMVAVQMGEKLLQDLTLKDVMSLMLKTVLHHILDVVLMGFLQVYGHYSILDGTTICIHIFYAEFV